MNCINCNSKWETDETISASITKCPFCGENPLVKKEEPRTFETSKDALAAIYKKFGADILLGKLNSYFLDFAPSVNINIRNLVFSVYNSGASKVLKENLNSTQKEKERAVKIALRNMADAFVLPEMAENIIYEFTDALGWKIDKTKTELPPKPNTQETPANDSSSQTVTKPKRKSKTKKSKNTTKVKKGNKAKHKITIIFTLVITITYLFFLWFTDLIENLWIAEGFDILQFIPLAGYAVIIAIIGIIRRDEDIILLDFLIGIGMIIAQSITICVWEGNVGILLIFLIGRLVMNLLSFAPAILIVFLFLLIVS
ncbi:MAG: hypothetical protein FWB86_08240 [Treponema sp.]|nr:hypothetical protein [Treponema sp.]MCL2251244.1 hypothetical protein [Treponema sp.]